jgi:hypothetical protein
MKILKRIFSLWEIVTLNPFGLSIDVENGLRGTGTHLISLIGICAFLSLERWMLSGHTAPVPGLE